MDRVVLALPVPASEPPLLLFQKRQDHRHIASLPFSLCILLQRHCSSFLGLTHYFWITLVCITSSVCPFYIFKWFSWLHVAKMLANFCRLGLLKTLGEMLCIILLLQDAGMCLPMPHTVTSGGTLSPDIWGIVACTGLALCLFSSETQNLLWEQCHNYKYF